MFCHFWIAVINFLLSVSVVSVLFDSRVFRVSVDELFMFDVPIVPISISIK